MEMLVPSADAEILTAVIAPDQADLERSAAESILRLCFTERQRVRMTELAEKNNAGTISDLERGELESFVRVGNFLNLVKAKARNSLAASAE